MEWSTWRRATFVFAKSDATAKIVFDDGCTLPLEVGTVFVLNNQSTCSQASGAAADVKPTADPAGEPSRTDGGQIKAFEQAALPVGSMTCGSTMGAYCYIRNGVARCRPGRR